MNKNLLKIALVLTTSLFFVGIAFLCLSGLLINILDDATAVPMFIISLFSAISILIFGLSINDE